MDKKVGEGYTKLLPHTHNNEIRNLLMTFAAREVIHQRAYAILSETLGTSDSGWREFMEYKEMQDKLDAMDVGSEDLSIPLNYAKALTSVFLSEGIGLFAAFANLLNFKRFGLIIGFNDVNQWSLNDEEHHVENNIRIVETIDKEELNSVESLELKRHTLLVAEKLKEAEKAFCRMLYEMGEAEDMTLPQLEGYIDHIHYKRLYQRGYIDFSEVPENTLPWMEWILDAERHGSFFEKRITDYSHTGLVGKIDYSRYQEAR
jgi:ribonucleotide reductase beta subunit family protein with ferritin-like domain